ncbi:MAG: hypothetical protein FJ266_16610 [Planctomycetes bacterium]|nr:hypothetical protein [Planctomycetota bacterium]
MGLIVIKESLDKDNKKKVQDVEKRRLFDAYKHCGVIKWKIKPVKYQKDIRDEWEHLDRH